MTRHLIIAAAAVLAAPAAPAWAWPPVYDDFRLAFETTYTIEEGAVERDDTLTFSHDFDSFDLLGSRGSFRLGLSTPFTIGDPLNTRLSLDTTLLWTPAENFTPAELLLRTPLTRMQDLLYNDPDEDDRPSVRFILPTPVAWDWLPRPFIGSDGRDLNAGLIMNFLSAAGTQPGATSFTVDTLRVDYQFAAVPEPASWLLWIGGLGVAGLVLRRRRADPYRNPASA